MPFHSTEMHLCYGCSTGDGSEGELPGAEGEDRAPLHGWRTATSTGHCIWSTQTASACQLGKDFSKE